MNETKCIIMSIKTKCAKAIISGEKTIELRKIAPKISTNDVIVFYESSPTQRVTFYCRVEQIIAMPPQDLWNCENQFLGITKKEYEVYFNNRSIAYGIKLKEPHVFASQKLICNISKELSAPQSFRYVSKESLRKVLQWPTLYGSSS